MEFLASLPFFIATVIIIVVIGWCTTVVRAVNTFEKKVLNELLNKECPLYDFNTMINAYHRGDTVEDTVEEIIQKWAGFTDHT